MSSTLDGVDVIVLRVEGPSDDVAVALRASGATVATYAVATVDDVDDDVVDASVGDLARFAWVAVTSRHAARRLSLWADRWPSDVRLGVVGPGTAETADSLGLRVDVVAPEGTARSLATCIDEGPVLFLAAASARDDLRADLAARSVDVEVVTAYAIHPVALSSTSAEHVRSADVVVVLAAVGVDALAAALDSRDASAPSIVSIGPTTTKHAQRRGLAIAATATTRAPDAVVEAVASLRGS